MFYSCVLPSCLRHAHGSDGQVSTNSAHSGWVYCSIYILTHSFTPTANLAATCMFWELGENQKPT